jgi:alkanesulfonate monooxygenase SsuD/methylene tetrahydromethanopterin reductase-like flavin-dependent oxidoreductase (luciferase family)
MVVTGRRVPLSVLDLVPVPSGATAAQAVHNSIDLARRAEALGYRRYWFAEHHLNPGVAGTAPAVMIGLAAAATTTIRVGSAGVQLGHRTPLSVVEEFGLLDCAYPGRLDLGLGRTRGTPRRAGSATGGVPTGGESAAPTSGAPTGGESAAPTSGVPTGGESAAPTSGILTGGESAAPTGSQSTAPTSGVSTGSEPTVPAPAKQPEPAVTGSATSTAGPGRAAPTSESAGHRPTAEAHTVDGVLIPSPPNLERLRHSPRIALARDLLQQPEAITPAYTQQIDDILALLHGDYRARGLEAHVTPGESAGVQLWILGSSGGESAEVAGHQALRFAANYHVSPATILEAVQAYRAAFRPGPDLDRPYVCVSVDVVIADDDGAARRLASGYGPWVLGIRSGEGAIPFPTEEEAAAHTWTDQDWELVADRIPTQIVGSPLRVVEQLERLVAVTGADELAVTTMTHDHADRVRSYELLAAHWGAS